MDLEAKKAAVTDRFDELAAQYTEIGDELKRLQGEYRLLQDLEKPAVKVKDEAKDGK